MSRNPAQKGIPHALQKPSPSRQSALSKRLAGATVALSVGADPVWALSDAATIRQPPQRPAAPLTSPPPQPSRHEMKHGTGVD